MADVVSFEQRQRAAASERRSSYAVTPPDEQIATRREAAGSPQADECRCPACLGLAPQGWARVHHISNDKGEHPLKPPFG
jgi:hypothetical protein